MIDLSVEEQLQLRDQEIVRLREACKAAMVEGRVEFPGRGTTLTEATLDVLQAALDHSEQFGKMPTVKFAVGSFRFKRYRPEDLKSLFWKVDLWWETDRGQAQAGAHFAVQDTDHWLAVLLETIKVRGAPRDELRSVSIELKDTL